MKMHPEVEQADISVAEDFERPETRLLLSLALPWPNARDTEAHRAALSDGAFDWTFFLDQAVRHRLTPLIARNMELQRLPYPSGAIREAFRAGLLLTRARNAAMCQETDHLAHALHATDIRVLLRKGQYLSRYSYPEIGVRPMSDIDFLVRQEDIGVVAETLVELGYQQGHVTPNLRVIQPLERRESLFWRLNTASQPPYIRLTSDPYVEAILVDLRWGILEPASGRSVDMSDWFERARPTPTGQGRLHAPCLDDLLLDVSVHLHREATTLASIEARKDLVILRFIDMLTLLQQEDFDPATFAERAIRCDVAQETAFAVTLLDRLYKNTTAAEVKALLPPVGSDDIDGYGALDGVPTRWKTDFNQRLFDNYRFREPSTTAKLRL